MARRNARARRISRGQFLKRAGVGALAVGVATVGAGRGARLIGMGHAVPNVNVIPNALGGYDVTATGDEHQDAANIQFALDNSVNGTVVLKAGTFPFNLGTGQIMDKHSTSITRSRLLIKDSVTLTGELDENGNHLTTILGGQSPPADLDTPGFPEADPHHGHGVIQTQMTGIGPFRITVKDLSFERSGGAAVGVLKSPNIDDDIRITNNKIRNADPFDLDNIGLSLSAFVIINFNSGGDKMLGSYTLEGNDVLHEEKPGVKGYFAFFSGRGKNKRVDILENTFMANNTSTGGGGGSINALVSQIAGRDSDTDWRILDNVLATGHRALAMQGTGERSMDISNNDITVDASQTLLDRELLLFNRTRSRVSFQRNKLTITGGKDGISVTGANVDIGHNDMSFNDISGSGVRASDSTAGSWRNNRISGSGAQAMVLTGTTNNIVAVGNNTQQFTPSSVHIQLESETSNNTVVGTSNTTVSDAGTNNTIEGAPE